MPPTPAYRQAGIPSPLRARLRPGRAHAPEGGSSEPEASRGEGEGGGDKAIFYVIKKAYRSFSELSFLKNLTF